MLDGGPRERVAGLEAEEGVVVGPIERSIGGVIDSTNDAPEVPRRLPLLAYLGQSPVRGAEKKEREDSTSEHCPPFRRRQTPSTTWSRRSEMKNKDTPRNTHREMAIPGCLFTSGMRSEAAT